VSLSLSILTISFRCSGWSCHLSVLAIWSVFCPLLIALYLSERVQLIPVTCYRLLDGVESVSSIYLLHITSGDMIPDNPSFAQSFRSFMVMTWRNSRLCFDWYIYWLGNVPQGFVLWFKITPRKTPTPCRRWTSSKAKKKYIDKKIKREKKKNKRREREDPPTEIKDTTPT